MASLRFTDLQARPTEFLSCDQFDPCCALYNFRVRLTPSQPMV